ncbi:hypothetical protein [Cellulomonas xiejunii]|uniref:hypothetical protein n=1 Tax=Cellulomonas xiejunii TaxID=2968083 RepID=UPI001D0E09FE|nr:hypothetical protein [Cellulomonas xiejunii]MCC2314071.1 hypothetical protein [Cellulomonas xiejunii]
MATMSLRMSDEDSALLRRLAERENRSMNDTAILAIRRLAEQTVVEDAFADAVSKVAERDATLLDLLSR